MHVLSSCWPKKGPVLSEIMSRTVLIFSEVTTMVKYKFQLKSNPSYILAAIKPAPHIHKLITKNNAQHIDKLAFSLKTQQWLGWVARWYDVCRKYWTIQSWNEWVQQNASFISSIMALANKREEKKNHYSTKKEKREWSDRSNLKKSGNWKEFEKPSENEAER